MAKKKPVTRPASLDELASAGYRFDPALESQKTDEPQAEPTGGMRRLLQDGGISLLKGAIGVPEAAVGLADIATGGRAGKVAERLGFRPGEAKAILDEQYTPETRAAMQKVQQADGFVGKLGAAIANPSVIGTSVVESLPMMGAGGVVGRGISAVAPRMSALMAGAAGEGITGAGSAAEQTRQQTKDGLLTPEQAALAGLSGVGTAAFGVAGGKAAQKLGIGDVDTMLVQGSRATGQAAALDATKKGLVRKFLEGAVSEGVLEELPQSMQEQVLQNAALGKPLDEGVDQAAALGLLSGMAMGGPAGALGHGGHAAQADKVRGEKLPEGGPMSRAVNAGIETTAKDIERGAVVPGLTAEQENDALSRMEAVMASDQKGLKVYGGGYQPAPVLPASASGAAAAPGAAALDGSAQVVDSPFADRVLELNGALRDPSTRAAIEEKFGPDAYGEALYYLNLADQPQDHLPPAERMPERTRDRLLQIGEAIVSQAVLQPLGATAPNGARFAGPAAPALDAPAGQPRIGLDTEPTGTIRVDGQGNAAPETRADAISSKQRADDAAVLGTGARKPQPAPAPAPTRMAALENRPTPTGVIRVDGAGSAKPETVGDAIQTRNRAEEAAVLGKQAPRATAAPAEPPAAPAQTRMAALTNNPTPSGRMVAGRDGVRVETVAEVQARQRKADADAELGLTPDVRRAQQQRRGTVDGDADSAARGSGNGGAGGNADAGRGGDAGGRAPGSAVAAVPGGNERAGAEGRGGNVATGVHDGALKADRWNKAPRAEREQLLGAAGWAMGEKRGKNTEVVLGRAWDKMSDSQRARIGAAMESNNAAAPQPAAEAAPGQEAAPAVDRAAAPGEQRAAADVPAAGSAGVEADGVASDEADLGPDTFAGSIKQEMERREREGAQRKAREARKKPAAPAPAPQEEKDAPVRVTARGDEFILENDDIMVAGNGDGSPRRFPSETAARDWASKNGFDVELPSGGGPAAGNVATGSDFAGKPINDEWTAFAEDSGTLGIPRAEMPQIKAEHRGAMVNFLAARGITHEQTEVPAVDLKPTQAEFSPGKVEKAKSFEGGDRSILVSSDGHVLDGHHQWLARRAADEPVKVIRLDAPIMQLLETVKEFPSAEVAGGATAPEEAKFEAESKVDEAPPAAADTITDVGEKIGGARKDMGGSGGGAKRRVSDDKRPAWARRFEISQIVTPGGMVGEVKDAGRWVIRDTRSLDWMKQPRQVGRDTFATKEEAEAFVPIAAVGLKHRAVPSRDGKYEIWRDISDRKRVKVVDEEFATRDEALAYMAAHAAKIIETNTTFGEADMPLPPDRARSGPSRRDGAVTGEDFKTTFGLRGVEFGNWNNQDERQALMNDAWDGLHDLADVLGIPPEAIGLNGDLALAFGARGHGLQGARAHYELDRAVINLTKEKGAGSLAHEWFHALDHYFGRQDGKASATWDVGPDGTRTLKVGEPETDMASSGFQRNGSGVRPEVRAAYETLLRTMFKKAEGYVEDMAKVDRFTGESREELARALNKLRADLSEQKDPKYWKRNNKPATAEQLGEFDAVAAKMLAGEALSTDWRAIESGKVNAIPRAVVRRWTNDALEKLGGIYKATRGRSGFTTDRDGVLDRLRSYMERYGQRLKMLADAQSGAEKTRQIPTEFAMNAKELDQGRGSDYWTTPHEMAARAFQGYVEDKIAEQGGVSRFLNYGPENAGILTPWGFKRPFPAGAERVAINKAFDAFVSELKTQATDKGVALFSRSDAAPAEHMTVAEVRAAVERLTAGWANAPRVEIIEGMDDPKVPQAVRDEDDGQSSRDASGEPEGFFFKGVAYLHAGHMRSEADVRRVLFHEALGHFGLRGLYGKALIPILDQIITARQQEVRAKASKYGLDASNRADLYAAAEEVLAEMAQSRPELGFVKRAIAAVRAWLRSVGLNLRLTDDDIVAQFLLPARRFVEQAAGQRGEAGSAPAYSWGKTPEEHALEALSKNDDLFQLPKSDKDTVEAITAENNSKIKVTKNTAIPGETRYNFVLPSGKTARMTVRAPNPYGANTYGFNYADGELSDVLNQRPGENPEDVPPTGDVWIDVSLLESGDEGRTIYNIASSYAHNTGRIFIGDPAGLSDEAMRRRPEMMLSSALKFGTTAHLAPHPRQVTGDTRLGIKPLKWVYGDHIGNIRRLIDLNLAALQNAGLDEITFDPQRGQFLDSNQQPLDRTDIAQLAQSGYGRGALAGASTLARGSVLNALSRQEDRANDRGGRDGNGLLERLVRQSAVHQSATRELFYSRAEPGVDKTSSEAFKRWFGDSKVVDGDGKPLRVYHGTGEDFSVFQNAIERGGDPMFAQAGLYFAESTDLAGTYGNRDGGSVMPVYLSIRNPLDLTDTSVIDGWKGAIAKAIAPRMAAKIQREQALRDGLVQSLITQTERDRLIAAGYDGIKGAGGVWIAFRPEQIKSAIGNRGTYDPSDADIRFSRSKVADAMRDHINSARSFALPAGYVADDFITTHAKLGFWQKTVGTPYNLAKKNPAFRRVFDAVQSFLGDVSSYATEAADLAPRILPKLETLADLKKSPLSPADTQALSRPVFEGTLLWRRDENGEPVRVDEGGEGPAGIVWDASELRSMFGLTEPQIALYREFRAATNESLRSLTVSEMVRVGGKDIEGLREQLMDMAPGAAARKISDALAEMASTAASPARAAALQATGERVNQLASRYDELVEQGYAPLSRFGTHTLDVVDGAGARVYFGLFESTSEANRMARQMRAAHPGATVTQGTLSQEAYKQFAGVSPETVALFGDLLGLNEQGDTAQDAVFQEYLKRAKSTRSAMRRLIHRKGIAGFSEDAGRVLAGFIYSNARSTSANLHQGDIGEAVQAIPKGQGELTDYALKMAEYTRNPQEEAQKLKSIMFAQFLGGSIASALVNMSQPIAVTFPYLSQFGGAAAAAKQLTQAVKDNVARDTGDAALNAALKRAEEEGIVSPQEVFHLMAQAQGSGALKAGDGTKMGNAAASASNALSKLSLAWGKLFSVAEQFNRRVTFIAAYRMAPAGTDPAKFAAEAVTETQFTYNKGNKPQWARGMLGSLLFTFKQYSVNYIELLARMANSGPEGRKAALLAVAVLALMGGADELPFLKDAQDVVDGLLQRLGYNFNSENARNRFLAELIGKDAARFVAKGVSGLPGVPIDISGRLGMGNLIPGTGVFLKRSDYTNDVLEIAGPAAKLGQNAFKAAGALVDGRPGEAVQALLPVAAQNALKGADMAATGTYKDTKGRKVIDTTAGEALVKAIGFQPESVARVQEASRDVMRTVELVKQEKSEIQTDWAQGLADGNRDAVEGARQRLAAWNRNNPEAPIRVNVRDIRKKVVTLKEDRATRLEKAAPKAIRAEVRKQLDEAAGG